MPAKIGQEMKGGKRKKSKIRDPKIDDEIEDSLQNRLSAGKTYTTVIRNQKGSQSPEKPIVFNLQLSGEKAPESSPRKLNAKTSTAQGKKRSTKKSLGSFDQQLETLQARQVKLNPVQIAVPKEKKAIESPRRALKSKRPAAKLATIKEQKQIKQAIIAYEPPKITPEESLKNKLPKELKSTKAAALMEPKKELVPKQVPSIDNSDELLKDSPQGKQQENRDIKIDTNSPQNIMTNEQNHVQREFTLEQDIGDSNMFQNISPSQKQEKYDLSEIPQNMRENVRSLIEKKVNDRVQYEMENLRAEAQGILDFHKRGHFIRSSTHKGKNYGMVDPYLHHPQYGYPYNHPAYYAGRHPADYNYYGLPYQGYPYPNNVNGYNGYMQAFNTFGHHGQPYGQTGQANKNDEDDFMYSVASASKMRSKSPQPGSKRSQFLNYQTDRTVELQIETPQGQQQKEYLVHQVSRGEEALTRRKAYDAHLKTDILLSGRDKSMNKTFDPYYHPHWAAAHPQFVKQAQGEQGEQTYGYVPYRPTLPGQQYDHDGV